MSCKLIFCNNSDLDTCKVKSQRLEKIRRIKIYERFTQLARCVHWTVNTCSLPWPQSSSCVLTPLWLWAETQTGKPSDSTVEQGSKSASLLHIHVDTNQLQEAHDSLFQNNQAHATSWNCFRPTAYIRITICRLFLGPSFAFLQTGNRAMGIPSLMRPIAGPETPSAEQESHQRQWAVCRLGSWIFDAELSDFCCKTPVSAAETEILTMEGPNWKVSQLHFLQEHCFQKENLQTHSFRPSPRAEPDTISIHTCLYMLLSINFLMNSRHNTKVSKIVPNHEQ